MYVLPDSSEDSFELMLRPSLLDVLRVDKVVFQLATLLEMDSLVKLHHTSRYLRKRFNKSAFKACFKNNSISTRLKPFLWLKIVNTRNIEQSLCNKLAYFQGKDTYSTILEELETMTECPPELKKSLLQVKLDVPRTLNEGFTASTEGQAVLSRVLQAVSLCRSDVGYCQGMNFVGAALLETLRDERLAFLTFAALLKDYGLDRLYFGNVLDYSVRVFQLQCLFEQYLPRLSAAFKRNEISVDVVFAKFILTLFGGYVSLDFLSSVYDYFIVDGWKSVFKLVILLLETEEENMKGMDLQDVSKYLFDKRGELEVPAETLHRRYSSLKVTSSRLETLKEEYFMALALERVNVLA